MQDAQELYLRYGITTVQDGFTRAPEWETLRRTAEEGALQLDVVSYVDLKDSQGIVKRNPFRTNCPTFPFWVTTGRIIFPDGFLMQNSNPCPLGESIGAGILSFSLDM